MSFLNELKNQAQSIKDSQNAAHQDVSMLIKNTEMACLSAWKYFQDLCAQLNVISPAAPGRFSLDGKAPFPNLQMLNFRCDGRKKKHHGQEVYEYVAVGWDLLPSTGQVPKHQIVVNFPPDLERVTQRLAWGQVPHERKEQRHPETNKLQAYVFEYETRSRGSITLTPEHDRGEIVFRVSNVGEFSILNTKYPATQVNQALLDELAKKLMGQTSRFG